MNEQLISALSQQKQRVKSTCLCLPLLRPYSNDNCLKIIKTLKERILGIVKIQFVGGIDILALVI